jgi:hypothetical protein
MLFLLLGLCTVPMWTLFQMLRMYIFFPFSWSKWMRWLFIYSLYTYRLWTWNIMYLRNAHIHDRSEQDKCTLTRPTPVINTEEMCFRNVDNIWHIYTMQGPESQINIAFRCLSPRRTDWLQTASRKVIHTVALALRDRIETVSGDGSRRGWTSEDTVCAVKCSNKLYMAAP